MSEKKRRIEQKGKPVVKLCGGPPSQRELLPAKVFFLF